MNPPNFLDIYHLQSHLIINMAIKRLGLKGFTAIDISVTVTIYRQKNALSVGAGFLPTPKES